MFPSQTTVSSIIQLDTTKSITSNGKTPQFDFDLGDFVVSNGKVVTVKGFEALKLWIKKILKTEKNKYEIYKTENIEKYGVNLLEIVTSKYPLNYIQAQVQSIVTEALLKNSDIKSVTNFKFVRDKRLLNCTFDINTIYGTTSESVVI